MQINTAFDRIWYVHNDSKFDTSWTTRREARERKRSLLTRDATNVTVSYVPVAIGQIVVDMHS